MVNAARDPLQGDIKLDDTWIGGTQPGLRGSRQLKGRKAALVLVACRKTWRHLWPRAHGGHPGFPREHLQGVPRGSCRTRRDAAHRRPDEFWCRGDRRLSPCPAYPADPNGPAPWSRVGRPAGRPCDRQPAAMVLGDCLDRKGFMPTLSKDQKRTTRIYKLTQALVDLRPHCRRDDVAAQKRISAELRILRAAELGSQQRRASPAI
jgi:hypothetical protein